jgi:hypothetical protein
MIKNLPFHILGGDNDGGKPKYGVGNEEGRFVS